MSRARPLQLPPPPKPLWFITFGDLLTLLLCFFLAIIPMIAKKSSFDIKNTRLNQEVGNLNSQNLQIQHLPAADGIQIAKLALPPEASRDGATESPTVFMLRNEDFSDAGLVTDRVTNHLKELVKSGSTEGLSKRIEVCAANGQQDNWLLAQQRALSIVRQINDSGFSGQASEIVVLGPHCELLQSVPQIGIAARVTFSRI